MLSHLILSRVNTIFHTSKEKKEISGWLSGLQDIYIENWNTNFLNKITLYGNEIE